MPAQAGIQSFLPSGFHLIEILIVLAIISILVSFAVPSYSTYIAHANRREAESLLMELASRLEEYRLQHDSYQDATLNTLKFPATNKNHTYQFQILSANQDTFLITAQPLHTQANKDADCGMLMLDAIGKKSVSGNKPVNECW